MLNAKIVSKKKKPSSDVRAKRSAEATSGRGEAQNYFGGQRKGRGRRMSWGEWSERKRKENTAWEGVRARGQHIRK
jgi:hypothetical protein